MKILINSLKGLVILTVLAGLGVISYGALAGDKTDWTLVLIGIGVLVFSGLLLLILYFVGKHQEKRTTKKLQEEISSEKITNNKKEEK